MISARLIASAGILVALSTASCTVPGLDSDSEQTETGDAAAQLPGEIVSTVQLRTGERADAVLDDALVVSSESEDGQETIRLADRNNGSSIWSTEGRFAGRQVKLIGPDDHAVVVLLSHSYEPDLLTGLDPATGDVLWAVEHAGGQVQVVRGTGTALVATASVPIVLDTATGDELWRGEPGDQMRAVLGSAVVTSNNGRRQVLRLRDGSRIASGLKSSPLNLSKATSAGPDTWLLGKGALSENGEVKWGHPKAEAKAILGDADQTAIVTKRVSKDSKTNKRSLTLQIHQTETGQGKPPTTLEVCFKGTAVGLSNNLLTWACPTGDAPTLVNVRIQ